MSTIPLSSLGSSPGSHIKLSCCVLVSLVFLCSSVSWCFQRVLVVYFVDFVSSKCIKFIYAFNVAKRVALCVTVTNSSFQKTSLYHCQLRGRFCEWGRLDIGWPLFWVVPCSRWKSLWGSPCGPPPWLPRRRNHGLPVLVPCSLLLSSSHWPERPVSSHSEYLNIMNKYM